MRGHYHDSPASILALDGGRVAQKRRTRAALVGAATELIAAGGVPSMSAAAARADVSVATAYRYFPSAEALAVEADLEQGMPRPGDLFGSDAPSDPIARIGIAAAAFQEAVAANESAARTMQRIAVSGGAQGGAALEGIRAGRRVEVIIAALEPLADSLPALAFEELVDALCLVIGVDAFVVARDLRGRSVPEAIATSRRAAEAIVAATLAMRARLREQP